MTLTDAEIRALNNMRRAPYAAALRAVAVRAAAEAMAKYEATPSTEENRLSAATANAVVNALFDRGL